MSNRFRKKVAKPKRYNGHSNINGRSINNRSEGFSADEAAFIIAQKLEKSNEFPEQVDEEDLSKVLGKASLQYTSDSYDEKDYFSDLTLNLANNYDIIIARKYDWREGDKDWFVAEILLDVSDVEEYESEETLAEYRKEWTEEEYEDWKKGKIASINFDVKDDSWSHALTDEYIFLKTKEDAEDFIQNYLPFSDKITTEQLAGARIAGIQHGTEEPIANEFLPGKSFFNFDGYAVFIPKNR